MNEKRFNRLIEIAKALRPLNHNNRCYHVTCILKKNKILSIGINNSKTHTRNLQFDYFAKNGTDLRREVGLHSEISAIIRGGREDYSDCVFVNIRINSEGKLLYSAPCRGCRSCLYQTGYKRLYYSTNSGEFVEFV
jgi:deoxycytidylate deaminase